MKNYSPKPVIQPKEPPNERVSESMSELVQNIDQIKIANQTRRPGFTGQLLDFEVMQEDSYNNPIEGSRRDMLQGQDETRTGKPRKVVVYQNELGLQIAIFDDQKNYQETLQQNQQNSCGLETGLTILGKIACLLLIVAAVMVMMYFQRCVIFDMGCQLPKILLPNLIVNRNFVPNSCFVINYTKYAQITTSGNTSHQRSNLTNYYCVKNVTQDGTLQMVGYQKRISEESLSQNSSEVLQVKYFDTEIGLQAALIGASTAGSPTNSSNNQNRTKSSITQQLGNYNISINQSELQKALTNLVMFRFTILRNGTFDRIQFDRRNNNATIGDLPKLIKMFFPKLSMELYTTSTTRLLIEDSSANSTNSTFGNQTNSTTDSNSSSVDNQTNPQNDQNSQYSYKQSESGGTQLINEEAQEPTNDGGLYSSQKKSTQSNFDGGSNLNSSKLSGSAEVSSPTTDPSEAATTYNLTLAMSVKENVEMNLVCTMLNLTQDIVISFEAYFEAKVVLEGYSLTFNQTELATYISSPQSDSKSPARLLIDLKPGQSRLFDVTKKISLLKTSVVGLQLKIGGQAYIFLGITKLQQYKFQPRFFTEVGIRFQLSIYEYYMPIFFKEHIFDPLNLGFTLSKVVGYIQKYSGGFLDKLSGITKLGSLATFTDKLGPTIKTIITGVTKGLSEIDAVRQLVLPITQVDSLTSNIISFYNTYEDYFNNLTNLNSNKITSLMSAITNYTNISLADSLAEFKKVQSQFLSYNLTGTQALQDLIASSTPILTQASAKIGSFLNSELNSLYNTEINKAKPFFDFYQYINSTSKDMIDNLTAQVQIFQSGFNKTLVTFLDDFYLQPLRSFDTIKMYSEQIRLKINNEVVSMNASMKSSFDAANKYLQTQIETVSNVYSAMSASSMNSMKPDYDSLISLLKSNANNLNTSLLNTQCKNTITKDDYSWTGWWTHTQDIRYGISFWNNPNTHFPQVWKDVALKIAGLMAQISVLDSTANQFSGYAGTINNIATGMINQCKSSNPITKKFSNINSLANQLATIFESNLTTVREAFSQLKSNLIYYKSVFDPNTVCNYIPCNQPCCQKGLIQNGIQYFDPMINQIASFTDTYMDTVQNLIDKTKSFVMLIQTFNEDNYNNTIKLITVGQNAMSFQKQSNNFIDGFTTRAADVVSFKKGISHNYKLGLDVKQLIAGGISEFQNYANDFCSPNSTYSDLVSQIKTDFNQSLSLIQNKYADSDLLKTAFNSLKSNLLNLSSKAFSVIDPLNLCTGTINVTISDLTTFINDTVNFDVIQKIAQPFWAQINITIDSVSQFKTIISNQDYNLRRLYDINQFNSFIGNCSLLANKSKELVFQFGTNVFELKKKLVFLDRFTTVGANLTLKAIDYFNSTPYMLNYYTMFDNITAMITASQNALKSVNFQTLKAFNSIKLQVEMMLSLKDNIISQTNLLVKDFNNVIDNFQKLQSGVTQSTLNAIDQSFKSLSQRINSSLVNKFSEQCKSFNKEFFNVLELVQLNSSLNFGSKVLEKLVVGASTSFIDGSNTINNVLANASKGFFSILNDAGVLLKLIKIGFLNEINLIGQDYKKIAGNFTQIFKKKLSQVLDIKGNIFKDISFVLGARDVLYKILIAAEDSYTQTLTLMQAATNAHLQEIQKDVFFYKQFSNTSIFSQINGFIDALKVDFTPLNDKLKPILDSMAQFESKLGANVTNMIKKLSYLKGNLTLVETNVRAKLSNIDNTFQDIKQCFTQIEKLIFLLLQNQLNTTVIKGIKLIDGNITSIFREDIVKVLLMFESIAPDSFVTIRDLLDKVIKLSYSAADVVDLIEKEIIKDINLVTNFINDKLINSFSMLKQAQNILKTITSAKSDQQKIVLYTQNLQNQTIPLFQLNFTMMTMLGPFSLTVGMDFRYGCDFVITLVNFRSVDFGLLFTTALGLQIDFSYGTEYILKLGVYLKGDLLNVAVQPGFQLANIVPVQLIKQIAPLAEFKSQNYLALVFYTDIQIIALSFQVGGFISTWTFEIQWIQVEFCVEIHTWFVNISFCVRFKLPLIKPVWKTFRFGKTFQGISVFKKRVLELVIYKKQL